MNEISPSLARGGSIPGIVCVVMGTLFLIVTLWGFVDGERVLIFHVNAAINAVRLTWWAAALICCSTGPRRDLGNHQIGSSIAADRVTRMARRPRYEPAVPANFVRPSTCMSNCISVDLSSSIRSPTCKPRSSLSRMRA